MGLTLTPEAPPAERTGAPGPPVNAPGGRRRVWLHAACLGVLALATLFLYGALLHRHVLVSHEGARIPLRTYEYLREIGRGHWIPQVFPDAAGGAGYAFPRFYPPVAYLISTALAALTGDAVRGGNLAFFLSVLLSGLAMYFMVLRVTRPGRPLVALAASLVYIALPYRLLDVFVRGALAECWTFVWYPLILAGTWETLTRRRTAWYLPPALCGLLLTHTATFLYFALVYGAVALVSFGREHRGALGRLAGALALAVGFGLWFLVPQLQAVSGVPAGHPASMLSSVAEVDQARVAPGDLLALRPHPVEGPVPKAQQMHLDLGPVQLLMPVLLGLLLLPSPHRQATGAAERRIRRIVFVLAGAWGASVLFMIAPRLFLQALPSQFAYIQFPWRLLGLAAFLSSAALGLTATVVRRARWTTGAVLTAAAVTVLLVPGYERSPAVAPVAPAAFSDPELARSMPLTTYTDLAEYRPIAIPLDQARNLPRAPRIVGDGAVATWRQDRRTMTAELTMRSPGTLVLPVLFYDFYEVRVDGQAQRPFEAGGFLALPVPAGASTVSVTVRLTAWSRLGFAGTVLSVAVYAAWLLNRRRRTDPNPGSAAF